MPLLDPVTNATLPFKRSLIMPPPSETVMKTD
jgi:hypothetical protein